MKDIITAAAAGITVALAGAAAGALITLSALGMFDEGDSFEPVNVVGTTDDTAQWCYPGTTNPDPDLRHGSWDCYETEQADREATTPGSTLWCYENMNRTGWDCAGAKGEAPSSLMSDTAPVQPVAPEEMTAEVLARLMPPPAEGTVS